MFSIKDVIEIVLVLAAILSSWYNLKERIKVIEVKVNPVYNWFINGKQETKSKSAGA